MLHEACLAEDQLAFWEGLCYVDLLRHTADGEFVPNLELCHEGSSCGVLGTVFGAKTGAPHPPI